MKIVVIAPPSIRLPVVGYGGIEAAAEWLAVELARTGHEVVLMGDVEHGKIQDGWRGEKILTEADPLSPDHYATLKAADVVHDFTHDKTPRLARTKRYLSTTMYSDRQSGRDVYPSQAVRDSFKDPKRPVIPLGIPVDGTGVDTEPSGPYVCLGRVAPYKGQDLAIAVAVSAKVQLTVAGHTGRFADPYYSLVVKRLCAKAGFQFLPDPSDLDALLGGAQGLLHTHTWLESFSIVAAQALLRGVPVLTTDVGAVQEWVRATDGGFIAPLKDLAAGKADIPQVAEFFATNWKSRREGIAKRARELFDVRRVAEWYLPLYDPGAKK